MPFNVALVRNEDVVWVEATLKTAEEFKQDFDEKFGEELMGFKTITGRLADVLQLLCFESDTDDPDSLEEQLQTLLVEVYSLREFHPKETKG